MKEIQMKISEICSLAGISPQGIRLYEKHNAIDSFKWAGNGYRYYYFENLSQIIGVKSFRNLGISLKKAADLCNEVSTEKMIETLHAREKEIQQEIKLNEIRLKYIKEMNLAIEEITKSFNVFKPTVRPAMYHLKCEQDNKILSSKEDQKLIRAWSHNFPFVKFCPVIEFSDITNLENLSELLIAKVGLSIKKEYASLIPNLTHPRVKLYEEQQCIEGVIRRTTDTQDYYSTIEPALMYLKDHNLELDGDILSDMIAPNVVTNESQKTIAVYYHIWIPYKSAANK